MGFRWCLLTRGELLLAALVVAGSSVCWGQARAKVDGNESTFDGSSIAVRYKEEGISGRNGSITAPLENIDVAAAKVWICASCGGVASITLNCKGGAKCVTGHITVNGILRASEGKQEVDTASDSVDLQCSSVSECEAFLQALRDAAGASSTYISGRRTPGRQDTPGGEEPVIDGSRIPKEIDFTKNGDSTASVRPARPAFDSLGSYLNSDDSAKAPTLDPTRLSTFFESETSNQSRNDPKEPRQPLQIDVKGIADKYGPDVVDGLRSRLPKTPAGAWRYVAGGWLSSLYTRVAQDQTSYAFTGKSFDELPDTFKKEYAVWDAGLKRILNPFSAKRGYAMVDALDRIFDLWEVQ